MNSDRKLKLEMTWQSVTWGCIAAILPDGFGYVCNCLLKNSGNFLPGPNSVI